MSWTVLHNIKSILVRIDDISELGNEYRIVCGNNSAYIPKSHATIFEQSEIEALKEELRLERETVDYYADVENWSRRESVFWESIDRSDCKDYPHLTRDIKLTGGHLARTRVKNRRVDL